MLAVAVADAVGGAEEALVALALFVSEQGELARLARVDEVGDADAEEADGRFEVFYNLYSLKNKFRLLIRTRLSSDDPEVDSLTSIWQSATPA